MNYSLVLLASIFFILGYTFARYKANKQMDDKINVIKQQVGSELAKLAEQELSLCDEIDQLEKEQQEMEQATAEKKTQLKKDLEQFKLTQTEKIQAEISEQRLAMQLKMEAELKKLKVKNEKELAFKKQEALDEIEQWTKKESVRLTEKLEAEYTSQFESIQNEINSNKS